MVYLFYPEEEAFEVVTFGVIKVDRMVSGEEVVAENFDIPFGIFGGLKNNRLKQFLVYVRGARAG